MLKARLAAIFLGIAAMLPLLPVLHAQAPAAPIPSQIVNAKKIFIANAGGGFDREIGNGEPSRTYNEFYAAIKTWGRYELVGSPSEADLVLQISIANSAKVLGNSVVPWFQVRLAILDPKTNVVLWVLDEWIPESQGMGMWSKKNRDKEIDDGLDRIVGDLKALTAQPATGAK
jgi:hypothetical protein